MLRLAIFLFGFLLPLWATAQYEWAPVGATWYINQPIDTDTVDLPYEPLTDYFLVQCTGDTVIQGMLGKIIGDDITFQIGDRVYLWQEDTLHLIYDFGASVGEAIEFSFPFAVDPFTIEMQSRIMVVDSIHVVDIDGLPHKMFYLHWVHPIFDEHYEYMERIGLPTMPVDPQYFYFTIPSYVQYWLRCYEDQEVQYRSPRMNFYDPNAACDVQKTTSLSQPSALAFRLYPNPAATRVRLELAPRPEELRVQVLHPSGQAAYVAILPAGAPVMDLPLQGLAAGWYFVELADREGRTLAREKLVLAP